MQQDQPSQGEQQQHTHVHAIIVDGRTIYEGPDMEKALRLWLEYGRDLNNQCVEHRAVNAMLAVWGRRAHEQE